MQPRDIGRTVLLCAIGGSADAIAYLRYDTFVGAMTGNTILLGIDFSQWRLDHAGYHLGIIAAFFAAVIITRSAIKNEIPAAVPLMVTALMLAASEFIPNHWSAAIVAAALGMQNAAVRTIAGVPINTVFITGNLMQLGSSVQNPSEPEHRIALALLTASWVAYAVGALIGAVALHWIGYPMLVPAGLALVAAIAEAAARRRHRSAAQ
jgi:uncharacterized membrane protein YoaK (UPF0700 family)